MREAVVDQSRETHRRTTPARTRTPRIRSTGVQGFGSFRADNLQRGECRDAGRATAFLKPFRLTMSQEAIFYQLHCLHCPESSFHGGERKEGARGAEEFPGRCTVSFDRKDILSWQTH